MDGENNQEIPTNINQFSISDDDLQFQLDTLIKESKISVSDTLTDRMTFNDQTTTTRPTNKPTTLHLILTIATLNVNGINKDPNILRYTTNYMAASNIDIMGLTETNATNKQISFYE